MPAQHININFAAYRPACLFEAQIAVVAIGDDLDQRAERILANRLICLLNGNAVGVL